MRYLVLLEATDYIEVEASSKEEAVEAAKDIFSPVNCDSLTAKVLKEFKNEED